VKPKNISVSSASPVTDAIVPSAGSGMAAISRPSRPWT
jgi:hypothetical protein